MNGNNDFVDLINMKKGSDGQIPVFIRLAWWYSRSVSCLSLIRRVVMSRSRSMLVHKVHTCMFAFCTDVKSNLYLWKAFHTLSIASRGVVAERSSLPDSSSGVSSRMWVRIPAVTLVSLSKTLNHNCFSPPRG